MIPADATSDLWLFTMPAYATSDMICSSGQLLNFWTQPQKYINPSTQAYLETRRYLICLAGLIHRLGSHTNTHPISNTNAAVVRLFRTGEVQQLLLHVNRISHEQNSSWELIKSAHQLFYSGDRTDHSSLGRALWRILIHFYNIEPVSKLQ